MKIGNYECQTTFWQDFTIAECFGASAILDTYRRAKDEWQDSVVFMTELVLVLNNKLWKHYDAYRMDYAKLYNTIWDELNEFCWSHFKGDDLTYFFEVTD